MANDTDFVFALCRTAIFLKKVPGCSAVKVILNGAFVCGGIGFLFHAICVQSQEVYTSRTTTGLFEVLVAKIVNSRFSPIGITPRSETFRSNAKISSVSIWLPSRSIVCSKAEILLDINSPDGLCTCWQDEKRIEMANSIFFMMVND